MAKMRIKRRSKRKQRKGKTLKPTREKKKRRSKRVCTHSVLEHFVQVLPTIYEQSDDDEGWLTSDDDVVSIVCDRRALFCHGRTTAKARRLDKAPSLPQRAASLEHESQEEQAFLESLSELLLKGKPHRRGSCTPPLSLLFPAAACRAIRASKQRLPQHHQLDNSLENQLTEAVVSYRQRQEDRKKLAPTVSSLVFPAAACRAIRAAKQQVPHRRRECDELQSQLERTANIFRQRQQFRRIPVVPTATCRAIRAAAQQ